MATDTGIVTIYDMENGGKPLTTHRVDAREFLAHPSGRWSASFDEKKEAVGDAEPIETGEDSGEAMRLKGMNFKALKAMAEKAVIPNWEKLSKPELVEALLAVEAA